MACDTFVALSGSTTDGSIIFAKNSDRPYSEIQNITHYPYQKHPANAKVRCTYIEIPQAEETHAVLLSQPSWMFGAEMGANQYGLVIGNEAVWTREPYSPLGLLGMDLLRLALERCRTAPSAIQTIVELLDKYGQGGACSEDDPSLKYHNSFMIADRKEAWVLETAGSWWVAEKIKDSIRNISNNLSIRSEFDLASDGIIDHAIDKGYYDQTGPFDFAPTFAKNWREKSPISREGYGYHFLSSEKGNISPLTMMDLLRNCKSGICMHGSFRTTASLVSHLRISDQDFHWMTGTPHPCKSFFKPISFPIASLSPYLPANKKKDQRTLWWIHEKVFHSSSFQSSNWKQNEKEFYSKILTSDTNEQNLITKKAFTIEKNLYDSKIN